VDAAKIIEREPARKVTVVLNWFEELRRRAPAGK
jgi:hypothetical protein